MKLAQKRNRRQSGWVELDKKSTPHCWKARYLDHSQVRIDKNGRPRPTQRSVRLGFKIKGGLETKGAAEDAWERIRPQYLSRNSAARPCVPIFRSFVSDTYKPIHSVTRGWRPATHARFDYYMSLVMPLLGPKLITTIKPSELQSLLNEVAAKYCHDTVNGIRTYLRSIFTYALEEILITKNPALRLRLPPTRSRKRPFATKEQMAQLELALAGTDRIMLRLFTRCGLRAGEVVGLKWGDLKPDGSIHIAQSVSKGSEGPPKTKSSEKPVVVPLSLFKELMELKAAAPDSLDGCWIFPAVFQGKPTGMPIDSANWLKRVLKPAAKQFGFEITLHAFRRGFATIAHYAGVATKNIQKQLRHSTASMTTDVYIQPIDDRVRQSVEAVDQIMAQEVAKATIEKAGESYVTPYATRTDSEAQEEGDVCC